MECAADAIAYQEASIEIAASPVAVYDLVSDLVRMAEWSPESTGGSWRDGGSGQVGDVFDGSNKVGDNEWSREVEVAAADQGRDFTFVTGGVENNRTWWSYEMAPFGTGTTLTEKWWVVNKPPLWVDRSHDQFLERAAATIGMIETTLAGIKKSAESDTSSSRMSSSDTSSPADSSSETGAQAMAEQMVSVSRVISASPEKIFDVLATPQGHVDMDGSGTVKGVISQDERLKLGSTFRMNMKIGVPYRMKSTVKEFEESRLIAWAHFFQHRWRYELEPVEGGTKVTETFDWSTARFPKGLEWAGYPTSHPKHMTATLERLAELVADK